MAVLKTNVDFYTLSGAEGTRLLTPRGKQVPTAEINSLI
jgi:hypothetical protein